MWKSNPSSNVSELPFATMSPTDTMALALLALGGLIVALLVAERARNRKRRKPAKPQKARWRPRVVHDRDRAHFSENLRDPKVQMDYVKHANFKPVRLLNKEEYRLLPILEKICTELGQGHRVMAQTSLGEVIAADAKDHDFQRKAHSSINSKRLDLAIFDRAGFLKAAVEYQGGGHYQDGSFMRDAVKREALRKAGVPMVEITKDDDEDHIKTLILRHLSPGKASQGQQPPR